MSTSSRFVLIVTLAALAGVTVASEGRGQDLATRVDGYLAPYLETGNFSGSILIARQGKVLLAKAYGMADVESSEYNTVETTYRLASVSRVFTSAAVLLLAQRGLLSVEDPVSLHLPGWPRGDDITIHHLLTLSAGFPNINTLPGYRIWEQSAQTPRSLALKFRDLPLEFEPGTRSVHSNSNYNVLAWIVERVSGSSFGDFLETEVFAPLGMLRSGHGKPARLEETTATGYRPVGLADLATDRTIDWTVKTGHASLYSTVEDIYRFDRALVEGKLLDSSNVSRLFTEHFPYNGYGWFVSKGDEGSRVYVNGRSPGFGTYWVRSVDTDVTVVVLGNIYNSVSTHIGNDLLRFALGKPVSPPFISTTPPDADKLAAVAGSYQFGPDYYRPNALRSYHIRNGHLFSRGDWLMPADDSGRRFVHRLYWSPLLFKENQLGEIFEVQFDDFIGKRQ